MKANKIIATLVVLTMLLSTLVVFNQLNVVNQASAQPGVDDYGRATKDLYYMLGGDAGTAISFNTENLVSGLTYYLFKPTYNCTTASIPEKFEWDPNPVTRTNGLVVSFTAPDTAANVSLGTIKLDRSGIWMVGTTSTSLGDFFWVNTSRAYTIDSISDITYGDTGTKTITVREGDSTVACFVDLVDPEGTVVFHEWTDTPGSFTFNISDYIEMAGKYKVRAYRDFDLHKIMYQYEALGEFGYDDTHGQGFTVPVTTYDYSVVGPWDPPEKNATEKTFTVKTAKPNMLLSETTLYWGYSAEIDVNITRPDGTGIDADEEEYLSLRAPDGSFYKEADFTYIDFKNQGNGNYTIEFPQWDNGTTSLDWAILVGGTWYVYFAYDENNDGEEEWNSGVGAMNRFTIRTTTAPVLLKILDDGSGDPTDKKVDIPRYYDGWGIEPLEILFNITGTSIINDQGRLYYGDGDGEDGGNITVTGDLLWPVDVDDPNHLEYVDDEGWWLYILPTKPGGIITISIDWPGKDNGTASQTIEVVNGSFVTTNFDSFAIGENVTLTVTVKDLDQEALKYAEVYLIWEDENNAFNWTTGSNTLGKGRNGEYSFLIDTVQQGLLAPKDLTVAVYDPSSGLAGYKNIVMTKRHNMKVDATPVTAYAGDSVLYDITVTLVEGGEPDEDSHGGLRIMIYNETGHEVTDPDIVSGIWPIEKDATITDREIILAGGTYYLYAYNDTHDSQGQNATLTVTSYTVTSSPSVLAWLIDTEVDITFQISPAVDGTLKLLNMTSTNATWLDKEALVSIEDGIGIIEDIDATDLGNVTYEFLPSGGEFRKAIGLLRVTTATATPNPATIYLGEPTVVTITITHPATGAPLQGVYVGLDIDQNISTVLTRRPANATTNAQGQVTFAVTAEASGNVTIYIQNETDPDNPFVIIASARKPMTISHSPSVNEGATFTIEAKSNDVLITDATVIFTFDGQTWPTTTGVATITAPSVATSMSYPITAIAEGYFSASSTIMVINVPKLIIAIAGEVKTGQSFTVTIADDKGGPVIGATVTFEGKTYTTGTGGVVTITAPSTAGNYPMTASFPGYQTETITVTVESGGGIPGFELLTLIAAIGVAFLLLRRRRK